MRCSSRRGPLLAAALCAAALSSDRVDAGAGARPITYLAAGSELRYLVVEAPLPSRALGTVALAAAERARDESVAVPSVLGAAPGDIPPAGWPGPLPERAQTGAAPLAAERAGRSGCRCETEIGDEDRARVAALYATASFEVGDEIDELRVLRLRARFRDGLVAYINGYEVARRNLAEDAAPMETAERRHGPEWETFTVPVTEGLLERGENLLAVEVRPSGRRLSPTLDVEIVAEVGGGRIVRGPMLQRVGPDAATILFDTDVPTRATVEYGPTAERAGRVTSADGALAVHHAVTIDDLPEGEGPIHYRVVTDGGASDEHRFFPAPGADEVLRFVVYGDVRGGHDTHARLVEAIQKEAPAFVAMTGDLVMRGSDEGDWQRFFSITEELLPRIPYYPAAGNHDLGRSGDERRRMNEIFALWPGPADRPEWGHWYSFDVAGVHFVMLDSNSYEHAEQLEWLERDLEAAADARAIFAVAHDGPYSRGLHRGNRYAAEHYAPILTEHGVTMLFSGHDHFYQRGEVDGLRYIVSGGGGAPLYPIRCGIEGRPRCRVDDGMQHIARVHHYVMVTVYPEHVEVCPKHVDGSPLESCLSFDLDP